MLVGSLVVHIQDDRWQIGRSHTTYVVQDKVVYSVLCSLIQISNKKLNTKKKWEKLIYIHRNIYYNVDNCVCFFFFFFFFQRLFEEEKYILDVYLKISLPINYVKLLLRSQNFYVNISVSVFLSLEIYW